MLSDRVKIKKMVKSFLNILNREISGLHQAAYLLGFFAICSQVLALFRDRILSCINDVSKLPGNTLLSGHGIIGRMLKTLRENKDPRTFNEMPTLENASILKIDWIK
jgi:hypothetical protein